MAVVIWCAIRPPHGTPLAQGLLGGVDALVSFVFTRLVSGQSGVPDRAARFHKFMDEAVTQVLGEGRIGGAPQPAAYHQIAAIRRDGMRRFALSQIDLLLQLAGTCCVGRYSLPVRRKAMAGRPDPLTPICPVLNRCPTSIFQKTAPPEITSDQFSG